MCAFVRVLLSSTDKQPMQTEEWGGGGGVEGGGLRGESRDCVGLVGEAGGRFTRPEAWGQREGR